MNQRARRILPLFIVLAALLVAFFLIKLKRVPEKGPTRARVIPVEVAEVQEAERWLPIEATGTVHPKYEVELVPQVSGLVVWIDPEFVRGHFFKKGELLFKIDDTDYVSALEEAKAKLTKAVLDLETIKAKAEIARREWELMKHPPDEKPVPLVFYEPQYENARQLVASARADVRKAEVDLERTRITAPFNCYIRSESVELGHYVRSGSKVAKLVYSDEAEVVLPVQEKYISWISARDRQGGRKGSAVTITTPGLGMSMEGEIDRIAPYVDSKTRLVDIFVVVKDPFCQSAGDKDCSPLPVGTFVEGTILGHTPRGACIVPASALRTGGSLYVVEGGGRLSIRRVKLLHVAGSRAWVSGDIAPGELVVTSPMRGAAPGMNVQVVKQEQEPVSQEVR